VLLKESVWIKKEIASLLDEVQSEDLTVLNLGSSSMEFAVGQQPYIWKNVFLPLQTRARVINIDIRPEPGIDLVLDFMNPQDQQILKEIPANIIIVSNLLEHLTSARAGISALAELASPETYVILSGPRIFPFHADPIDNGFRPSKRQLREMLSNSFKIIKIETVSGGSVLTCTSENKKEAYGWYVSLFKKRISLQSLSSIGLATKHLLFPAIAFVCVLQKLPSY